MTDDARIEQQLRDAFVLRRRPVAVSVRETAAPAGVELGDDELYVAIPGRSLTTLAADAETVAAASAALSEYRRARRQALATE